MLKFVNRQCRRAWLTATESAIGKSARARVAGPGTQPGPAFCTSGDWRNGEHMHRVGDVLQPLFSEIDELGSDHSANMAPGVGGDADAAGCGEALETRGEVDVMPVDIVRRDDHIAEIDTHAELDP